MRKSNKSLLEKIASDNAAESSTTQQPWNDLNKKRIIETNVERSKTKDNPEKFQKIGEILTNLPRQAIQKYA